MTTRYAQTKMFYDDKEHAVYEAARMLEIVERLESMEDFDEGIEYHTGWWLRMYRHVGNSQISVPRNYIGHLEKALEAYEEGQLLHRSAVELKGLLIPLEIISGPELRKRVRSAINSC